MTGSFLQDLESLKNIEYLFIQCKNFSSKNLQYLSNFPKLKTLTLDLKSAKIDNSSLTNLENINLETLTLRNMYINEVGFASIPKIKSLKELNLDLVSLNYDVDLNSLRNLNLEKLSINFIDIGTLKEIQNIKTLKELSLVDTLINDEELKYLMNLPNLETLYIGMNEFISKKGIKYIENHPSLKSVDASNTNIEDTEGINTNFKLYI